MDFSNQIARNLAVERAQVIRQQVAALGHKSSADSIDQAIQQFHDDKITILVMGKGKRGKSTLINAFLGRKDDLVAPIDKLPASSVITRCFAGPEDRATVRYRTGTEEPIAFERIKEFATEEENPGNRRDVAFIDVVGQFPTIDPNVVLVDTPGAGSWYSHHDVILFSFLPLADAVIFLVTARDPLDQDEVEMLKKLQEADIRKIFFAINKVDASTPQETAEGIEHDRRVLQHYNPSVGQFHQISAKKAFTGDLAGSGLLALTEQIRIYLAEKKGMAQIEGFASRIRAMAASALDTIDSQIAMAGQTQAELDRQMAELAESQEQLVRQLQIPERQFVQEWRATVDDFDRSLERVRREVQDEITKEVEAIPLWKAKEMRARVPGLIFAKLEKRLSPMVELLSSRLSEQTDAFGKSITPVRVKLDQMAKLGTLRDDSMMKGTIKAGTGILGGLGLSWLATTVSGSLASTTLAAASTFVIWNPLTWISAGVGAGTSTVVGAAMAPVLMFLGGPAAIAVAAIGIAGVPLAWKRSLQNHKDSLPLAAREFVADVVDSFRAKRLGELRDYGSKLAHQIRTETKEEIIRIQQSLQTMREERPSPETLLQLQDSRKHLAQALDQVKLLPVPTR